MPLYADIILPLAQPAYTFEVAQELSLVEGDAVVVPFGQGSGKYYTGIVRRIHSERPAYAKIKYIERKLYSAPLLNASQIRFWVWIAEYYMCTIGDVMRVALPSLMKPSASSSEEFAMEEYRLREEYYITLDNRDVDLEKLEQRAPKQYSALKQILQLDMVLTPRRLLDTDMPTLRALERKGIISVNLMDCAKEPLMENPFVLPKLTEHQGIALGDIKNNFAKSATTLLYGVTGSGKTEIYIHLIAEALSRGEDVLLLLPEIALTAQLVERMERIFGARVVAYHSRLTQQRRTETYLQINNRDGGNFVVGVRSAIFLPLKRLGLIIVDEEHDSSYKQSDPAPRYNARDCAVALASMQGINTLLGSATPSLESWVNAQSGKYGLAELTERYGDAVLPNVTISDTLRAVKRGERRNHFNFDLRDAIEERVARSEQVILFQNRRGYAPYIECCECGWSAQCPHCNVTLTLHRATERLTCHYCGYQMAVPAECPECKSVEISPKGFGTEKIEEQLQQMLPEARVARLDRDSVTSQSALDAIVSDFASHRSDILVGTQMVTKGFDFGDVTLVGVLNADNLLHNPDFRAEERAFQLLMQVSGRAGRRATPGEVIIQSSQPEHRVLKYVAQGDYPAMMGALLDEREIFSYPPYGKITTITMRHKDRDVLYGGANALAASLRAVFGRRLQGPVTPAVDKIRDEYIVVMNLKIEAGASAKRAREILAEQIAALRSNKIFKYINIICNVDPQ